MNLTLRIQLKAIGYFAMATLFTWWFIAATPLPIGREQIVLSNVVAIGKWAIQFIAAFILLRDQRWVFIKDISFVYLLGSCLLIPFVILNFWNISHDLNFFTGSQLLSVLVMVFYYHRAVQLSHLNLLWWLAWLACQIVSIILQITVVFHAL